MRRGDLILELAGTGVAAPRTYFEILRGIPAGDAAPLRVEREGRSISLSPRTETFPEERADDLADLLLGLTVEQTASGRGLAVSRVGPRSPAARIGLRPGDRILKVDRAEVSDRAAFRRAVSKLRGRRTVLLLVQRGDRGYHLTLPIS